MIWDVNPFSRREIDNGHDASRTIDTEKKYVFFSKGLLDFYQILFCVRNFFLRWSLFQQHILENMAYDKPFAVN